MQPTAKLPIDAIIVGERFRKDLGDIDSLAESIASLGLIQPVVINAKRELVAGGRRLHACKQLKWTHIPVTLAEGEGTETELRMMELEENVQRSDMTWKEKVLSIDEIHRLHKSAAVAAGGEKWLLEHTGRLIGMTAMPVSYAVRVARHLKNPGSPLHKCDSLAEAIRALVKEKQDQANRHLVAMSAAPVKADAVSAVLNSFQGADTDASDEEVVSTIETLLSTPTQQIDAVACIACEGTGVNSQGRVCPICKGTGSGIQHGVQVIKLSDMLWNMDCLEFLKHDVDKYDHIITDPPYAIDMDMLAQDDGEQMYENLDTVVKEHDVEENLSLLEKFVHLAAQAVRPGGFLIMWCDYMHFRWLHDLGIACGLRVQRWPLVWVKTHTCANRAAMSNFTKSNEIAIVMGKGTATLLSPQPKSHFLCNRDSAKQFGHPFAKPVELWDWVMRAVASPGQTILDPFAGRGSAIYAGAKAGYHVVGVEKQPEHFDFMTQTMKDAFKLWLQPKEVKFT